MLDKRAIFSISNRNSQLMLAFCTRVSQDPRSIRFLFDGNILNPEGSAESLQMEDGDEIDAMLSQVGGRQRHPQAFPQNSPLVDGKFYIEN